MRESKPGLPEAAWLSLALIVAGLLYWLACDQQILGFDRDDGVYAITAKALAEGKGFTLLQVVGEPAQVKYPPLYPVLLAGVWGLNPDFPDNIPWMHALTILLALGGFAAVYAYFRQARQWEPWQAGLVTALTIASPAMLQASTTMLSEAPYLLFSFLLLREAERFPETPTRRHWIWLILWSVLAFHTRVIGFTLVAAVALWFWLKGRRKDALLYGGLSALLTVLPWGLWVRTHTPAVLDDGNFPLVYGYSNYAFEWAQNASGSSILLMLARNAGTVLQCVAADMLPLLGIVLGKLPASLAPLTRWLPVTLGGLVLATIATIGWRARKDADTAVPKPPVSLPGLYLAFYLIVLALWGYEAQVARFLVVVLPLLWGALLWPLLRFPEAPRRALRKGLLIALVALVLLPAPKIYWSSYVHIRRNHLRWLEHGQYQPGIWAEYQAMFEHMNRHIPDRELIAGNREIVTYLYTGHPGYYLYDLHLKSIPRVEAFTPQLGGILLENFRQHGVRYLLVEPEADGDRQNVATSIPERMAAAYPEHFTLLHRTTGGHLSLYRFQPPVAARGH